MAVSIAEFWKLLAASGLYAPRECEALAAEFSALKGAGQTANSKSLAQWLVASGKLTKYQASMLLAGRGARFAFGPFVVTDRIAEGRLAGAYTATFERKQRVLLVPLSVLTDDPREYGQYGELAAIVARAKSPHVSRTFVATRQGGESFIAVEALSGRTLAEVPREKISLQTACQIGMQVALGLVSIHEQQLTHGAVAPRNVWITSQGSAKLLQFPLVQPARRVRRLDPPLIEYLAPEWTRPETKPTPLVDIYALGCLMFELITGSPPFPGGDREQKLDRQRRELPQRLHELNTKVHEDLSDLIDEMLAKDPILRCQSASHAAHVLARFAANPSGRGRPPQSDPSAPTVGYGAWEAPTWEAPPQQPGAKTKAPPPKPAPPEPTLPKIDAGAEPQKVEDADEEENIAAAIVIPAPDEPAADTSDTSGVPRIVVTDPSESTSTAGRVSRREGPKSRRYLLVGGGALAVVVLVGGLLLLLTRPASEAPPVAEPVAVDPVESEPVAGEAEGAPEEEIPGVRLIEDDGRTLWQSPTLGAPLQLDYVPSGAQVIAALRPAELLAGDEGAKLIGALGPYGPALVEHLRRVLGVELSQVEQLLVAFVPDDSLQPRAAYVAHLTEAVPRETLLAAWGNPAAASHAGRKYFAGQSLAYYLPEAHQDRVVAIAPPAMMQQLIELDGKPLLRSGLENLLEQSDESRQLTLLFVPGYLQTDGQPLLAGELAQLQRPLANFLDDKIDAVLLSAHLGDDFHFEFRAIAPVGRKPLDLLAETRSRWEKLPEQVESHIDAIAPGPHGETVVRQFPQMLKQARVFTRTGVEDRQIVMAAYLPRAAAHNLLMGAELTLAAGSGAVPVTLAATTTTKPRTAAEALAGKITLSFPRETLEGALGLVSQEIGLPIIILGNDLQLEGITRNQSLNDVDQRDQPAADVLRKLLLLANPDGKLVYQIRPDAAGQETVQITTRAAVNRRGEEPAAGF